MSEIPYFFRAIPEEFLTDAFIEDIIMMKLVRYIMKRVRYVEHEEVLQNNRTQKKVKLKPFEWIYGREAAAKECGTTDNIMRKRINQQLDLGYIKKCTSSCTSTYTVYAIVPAAFKQNDHQQLHQQNHQQLHQQLHHNEETKNEEFASSFKKETIKKEKIVRPLFRSSLLHEEDFNSMVALSEANDRGVPYKDFVTWNKKHDLEEIVYIFSLMLNVKEIKKKPAAWMQSQFTARRYSKDLNEKSNRTFCEELKFNYKLSNLVITEQYARDALTGNDYQFWWETEEFERIICEKFNINNIKQGV